LVTDIKEAQNEGFVCKVLIKILRPKGDEVAGGPRWPHTEEVYKSYSSPSVLRIMMSRK
jgi:hypothetical protein